MNKALSKLSYFLSFWFSSRSWKKWPKLRLRLVWPKSAGAPAVLRRCSGLRRTALADTFTQTLLRGQFHEDNITRTLSRGQSRAENTLYYMTRCMFWASYQTLQPWVHVVVKLFIHSRSSHEWKQSIYTITEMLNFSENNMGHLRWDIS